MSRPLLRRTASEELWERVREPEVVVASESSDGSRSILPPACSGGFCSNVFATQEISNDAIIASHAAFEKAYLDRVGCGADGMRCGLRMSPSPFLLPRAKLQEMADLQAVLSSALAAVLKSWGTPDSWLRRTMPLPKRATDVLLRCCEFTNGLPNTKLPIGCFRPDVLIGEDGRLQVCEINARFALNAFFLTLGCAEALHLAPSSSLLGSLGIGVVPSTQSLVTEIVKRFQPKETLFVIVGRERLNDLAVLEEMFHKHRGDCDVPSVRYVHPNQLRGGKKQGSLVCVSDGKDAPETVKQCILELHQDELLRLSDSVLDGITALSVASCCLNPIWTILLCHDKRLLGVLRSLTSQELPDKEARRFLKKHIVPTTHLEDIESLKRIVLKERGLRDYTLVAKPCGLGKGEGIILEKDFDDEMPSLFIDAVFDAATKIIEIAERGEVFPYIAQAFVCQKRFNVIRPPDQDSTLTPVAWHVVGTILCIDGQFLGPGIFRSSEKNIVALCNGGMILAPALSLPFVPSHLRFVGKTVNHVQTDKVRGALINHGLAMLFLDEAMSDSHEFAQFIQNDLGAVIHQHSSTVGSVWKIQPMNGGKARSHTSDAFLPHTDASFESCPPRFFALSVVHADRCCGGLLGLASVEEAIERLNKEDFDILRNTVVHWRRPDEFSKDALEDLVAAPVLFSRRRARLRTDIMETAHLSSRKERQFWDAYNRFYTHLDEMCHSSARLLPERTILLVDNQRFVHARTRIKGTHRLLLRIRFDFHETPELQSLLEVASANGLGPQSNLLTDWPIQTKFDYMENINSKFIDRYCARGRFYWSPSGGSTSATKGSEVCAVPSTNQENSAMRTELVDLFCGVGAVPRDGSANCVAVNLFASGKLYRSMEIFGEVFTSIDATHLPLGSTANDDDVLRCIARFGANILCGWGSRILQLCEAAESKKLSGALTSIKTIIHGGEMLSVANRSLMKKVCGGNVRIFGCYGSAETGVFGVSIGDPNADHETYRLLSDCVHVEIVDDNGLPLQGNEWGNIVVTNLKRITAQPLVRFSMGDIGRLVNSGFGEEKALHIKGRSGSSLTFKLNPNSDLLIWADVEQVLQPLASMASTAGVTCLAQIIVTTTGKLILAIFTPLPQSQTFLDAAAMCSSSFSELVSQLGNTHIENEIIFLNDMSELRRSPRSQKLMLWVDQRQ
ncbi:hypothetical protein HJC23_002624 [Cyclotella cryptica]|uniref:TauD/TfdA-like domain-containing protein n=1 Tax=Cyclotella cryptica TaxID=29204 RepID=A0ABD3PYJ1_9STRA|eukprot:CCRYP_010381-RA/>CCRYP_010381-RA protein AED:0.16 eAED:0.16 QI:0/-1/0/1/-1/1/1/0/1186